MTIRNDNVQPQGRPRFLVGRHPSHDGCALRRRRPRLQATAHFDNSTNNLGNPDPTRTVRYGRQTFEEMMNGWVKYDLPRRDPESADD